MPPIQIVAARMWSHTETRYNVRIDLAPTGVSVDQRLSRMTVVIGHRLAAT
jgi:hypothetical protein